MSTSKSAVGGLLAWGALLAGAFILGRFTSEEGRTAAVFSATDQPVVSHHHDPHVVDSASPPSQGSTDLLGSPSQVKPQGDVAVTSWVSQESKRLFCKVVGVTDGDTVTVLDNDLRQLKIRLSAIDAPEASQAFGTKAKQALSEKVFGKRVSIAVEGQDQYGRTLGQIYVDDRWVNLEMVAEGWAWHYLKYSDDWRLAAGQRVAQNEERGLWRDVAPIAPWDFRRGGAGAVASPSGSVEQNNTVYVTRTGSKYHVLGCRYLAKSSSPISVDTAQLSYEACSVCNPPSGANLTRGPPSPVAERLLVPQDKPHVAENGSYYGEASSANGRPKTVHVRGYYRKDGTYVRGHYRSR